MESRFYPGVQADSAQLLRELRALFDADPAFELQTMQVSSTAVLQARKSSTLRDLTGLSAALTIKITPEHGGTRVELGMQKWLEDRKSTRPNSSYANILDAVFCL